MELDSNECVSVAENGRLACFLLPVCLATRARPFHMAMMVWLGHLALPATLPESASLSFTFLLATGRMEETPLQLTAFIIHANLNAGLSR